MLKKIYIYFIGLCLIYSCKSNENNTNTNNITSLNISNCEVYNPIDSCIKDIKILPLQTDPTCLVGYINKIEIHDPYIFIFDYNNNFFIFRIDGSYVSKITATGRGPKEITKLKEFYINPYQKYIGIFDNIKQKIFRFNYEGELIKIVACENSIFNSTSEMKLISPNELLLTLNYEPNINSSYAIINPENYSVISKLLKYPYQWQTYSMDANFPKQFGNKTNHYIVNMLSDTLYTYNKQHLTPRLIFKSSLPMFTEINPEIVKEYSDVVTYAHNHHLSQGIPKIIVTDSIGYTEYYYNGNMNHVFWYLNTTKTVCSKKFGDNPNIFKDFNICSATEDYFVGFIFPNQINYEIIRSECSPEISEKLLHTNEDDNPILVFYNIHF